MAPTTHFILYQDAKSEYRWRLVAANGRTIADSAEGYLNEADARHAIALVKEVGASTRVRKLAPEAP